MVPLPVHGPAVVSNGCPCRASCTSLGGPSAAAVPTQLEAVASNFRSRSFILSAPRAPPHPHSHVTPPPHPATPTPTPPTNPHPLHHHHWHTHLGTQDTTKDLYTTPTTLQGLGRRLWQLWHGGLLLLLVGRGRQQIYSAALRSELAWQQTWMLASLASAIAIAAGVGLKTVGMGVALLFGVAIAIEAYASWRAGRS